MRTALTAGSIALLLASLQHSPGATEATSVTFKAMRLMKISLVCLVKSSAVFQSPAT